MIPAEETLEILMSTAQTLTLVVRILKIHLRQVELSKNQELSNQI